MNIEIQEPLGPLLLDKGHIVIDGALATELEVRGHNLNDPLWSAKVLIESPEDIYNVHRDYFAAGADIAITASYQATEAGLAKRGLGAEDAAALFATSAELAQRARSDVLALQPERRLLVAGSIGPYGAYLADGSEYTGNYHVAHEEMKVFHRLRISALLDAHVDILACETLPSIQEAQALVSLIEEYRNASAWFSFTLRDEFHISDGTPLEEVCALLNQSPQVVAIGLNCVGQHLVSPALERLRVLTQKPLVVYPNSGEIYDAETSTWHGSRERNVGLGDMALQWKRDGARLIGGCCRTGPSDIEKIRLRLDNF